MQKEMSRRMNSQWKNKDGKIINPFGAKIRRLGTRRGRKSYGHIYRAYTVIALRRLPRANAPIERLRASTTPKGLITDRLLRIFPVKAL